MFKIVSLIVDNELDVKLEDIFSSDKRTLILMLISRKGKLNISEISSFVGCSIEMAKIHLTELEQLGILVSVKEGRDRYYMLNTDNKYSLLIKEFMNSWI